MSDLDLIDPYPWFLQKPMDMTVDDIPHGPGTKNAPIIITATEWAEHWRPFLARLLKLFMAAKPKRFLVAIGGPPGAGKTILAEQLHWIAFKGFMGKDCRSCALPMDGFHYPNEYLKTQTRKLPDGTEIHLSSLKGAPDTFDVAAYKAHLQRLIQRPENMSWPGYSRFHHDIQPDKYRIHETINLVFVDGNYTLLDRGPFSGLPDLFDLRLYVHAPAMKVLSNLMERHIKGGRPVEEAKAWVKRIDLPNMRIVESTRHRADVIIEKNHDDDFANVVWKADVEAKLAAKEHPPREG